MRIHCLVLCCILAGCSPRADRPPLPPPPAASEIGRHVRYLASDELRGRRTGEEGNREAASYVADHFAASGLAPAGDNGGYLQAFRFLKTIRPGDGNALAVAAGGTATTVAAPADFLPLTISPDTDVTGPLVFAGYGISATRDSVPYDDYAGIEVRGAVVAVLRFSPAGPSGYTAQSSITAKAMAAREHGAAGILFLTAPEGSEGDALSSFRPPRADAAIAAAAVRRSALEPWFRAAGKSLAALQARIDSTRTPSSFALPGATVHLRTAMVKEYGMSANVAGFLEGSDPALRSEVVVLGAHFDHLGMGGEGSLAPDTVAVHHGADDNASGTAGLLEAARALAARRGELRRSVLFLGFSGEELGLLGSDWYVKHPLRPLASTVAMLNMDMIGRMKDSVLVVEGMGTSPRWEALVRSVNADSLSLRLKPDGFGPSDHASFYARDIPVLFFFTNLHSDYHRPSDTWEKINTAGEEKVVRAVVRIAGALAADSARPAFTKAAPVPQGPAGDRAGVRVSLGVIPDYAAEGEGLRISGTRAGSAAEKAGLMGNDTIIRFAGRSVKNIYDFMALLEQCRPGDKVEIVVRRGSGTVTLPATLEARK